MSSGLFGSPVTHLVRRILVVDDNVDAADSLAMVLTRIGGHSVTVAYRADQAFVAARAHLPEVVLLDIGMPQVDGYAVARQLREMPETRDATIIAVTGYGRTTDRAESLAAGFDLHLLKPVDPRELLAYLLTIKT